MRLVHLSLTNFRNFGRLDLRVPDGITLVHGANAQGKTNLLEAIYYLATTRSPYTNQDDQLIHWDAGYPGAQVIVGRLVAHVETTSSTHHLELRLIRELKGHTTSFRREALVDRRKVRLLDLLGNLRVVLFVPTDLDLVTGSPASRRRYINISLCQRDRVYCRTLSQYNKLLEQRNALLRQIADEGGRSGNYDLLSLYNEQLIDAGSRIFAARAQLLRTLARDVQRIHYEQLTNGHENIRLMYHPRLEGGRQGQSEQAREPISADWLFDNIDNHEIIASHMRDALEAAQAYDVRRGTTSVGPHRDDWVFQVDGRSLQHYGSRGQQRSAVLALKLGEIVGIRAETGESPILLLDDVMAELDRVRRGHLLEALQQTGQGIITSADTTIFPASFLAQSHLLSVTNGIVNLDTPNSS